ncbi:uncharacterized protein [Euwallacea fornicatus]|uniref:uncharacterized protein n=1 Tax=Euwallacea fornicatus TaxID=995702 RepID=UPI00338DB603
MVHFQNILIAFFVSMLILQSESRTTKRYSTTTENLGVKINWDKTDNPCLFDSTKGEVCQRCAKQTKSPIVYPMCCHNEEKVYDWCYSYISYDGRP